LCWTKISSFKSKVDYKKYQARKIFKKEYEIEKQLLIVNCVVIEVAFESLVMLQLPTNFQNYIENQGNQEENEASKNEKILFRIIPLYLLAL
jgi:hypothetical protein